jgi:hypothetical protein
MLFDATGIKLPESGPTFTTDVGMRPNMGAVENRSWLSLIELSREWAEGVRMHYRDELGSVCWLRRAGVSGVQ